ncbi:hypothetical protein BDW22DRAFT_1427532 [Trametopsis cervina]|nr:hypothetical protein BDW22DRAFT_1427532 [Trametopsis cervina]
MNGPSKIDGMEAACTALLVRLPTLPNSLRRVWLFCPPVPPVTPLPAHTLLHDPSQRATSRHAPAGPPSPELEARIEDAPGAPLAWPIRREDTNVVRLVGAQPTRVQRRMLEAAHVLFDYVNEQPELGALGVVAVRCAHLGRSLPRVDAWS